MLCCQGFKTRPRWSIKWFPLKCAFCLIKNRGRGHPLHCHDGESLPLGDLWVVEGSAACYFSFPWLELQHGGKTEPQRWLAGSMGMCEDVLLGYLGASPVCAVVQSWWGLCQRQCAYRECAATKADGGQIRGEPFPSHSGAVQAAVLIPPAPRGRGSDGKCSRQKSASSRVYTEQDLAFSCNLQIPGVVFWEFTASPGWRIEHCSLPDRQLHCDSHWAWHAASGSLLLWRWTGAGLWNCGQPGWVELSFSREATTL